MSGLESTTSYTMGLYNLLVVVFVGGGLCWWWSLLVVGGLCWWLVVFVGGVDTDTLGCLMVCPNCFF